MIPMAERDTDTRHGAPIMTTQADLFAILASKPLSQLNEEEMREARQLALSILRADYYADVRNVASSIKDAVESKEVADAEQLSERIHEECDGAARVIYTAQAQEAILLSDNSSAYVDEFGEDGIVKGGDINWSALAFAAFQQDVREQLDAEGIDDSSFDEEEATDDDEAEGDEIEEGDITTSDGRTFYQYGKQWLRIDDIDTHVGNAIKAKMEAEGFYPNVWTISDHGNAIPFDLDAE
jgi:hypothetical protein